MLSFYLVALMAISLVVTTLAIGGRPDPMGPAAALDGTWRFHPGDDPNWADPQLDDRNWERIDLLSLPSNRDDDVGLPGLLSGWTAHGHPKLEGYGWYRRRVTFPAGSDFVVLGPTMVDDGYEMFWNGRPLGGIGHLGAHPHVIGARPYLARLSRQTSARSGVLAIRTFMQPGFDRDNVSGGLRSVPTLAEASFGERLHRAQWMRTIAGYIVEVALPFMMILLACTALVAARSIARPSFARWLAFALVATGFLRMGNAIGSWTDLLSAPMLAVQNPVILSPFAMLGWTAAWNEWAEGRDRPAVLLTALTAWGARVVGAVTEITAVTALARYVYLGLFVVIAVRIAKRGPQKGLALATMGVVATALFINEIKKLGIPDIWFPFNIGVTLTQYALALATLLLPLLLDGGDERGATVQADLPDRAPVGPASS